MNLAGTHVHAVERVEAGVARLLAQERHLLVDEVARVARARRRASGAGARREVMHVPASGLLFAPTTVSGMTPFGTSGSGDLMIGLKLILTIRSANSCSFRNCSSAG